MATARKSPRDVNVQRLACSGLERLDLRNAVRHDEDKPEVAVVLSRQIQHGLRDLEDGCVVVAEDDAPSAFGDDTTATEKASTAK